MRRIGDDTRTRVLSSCSVTEKLQQVRFGVAVSAIRHDDVPYLFGTPEAGKGARRDAKVGCGLHLGI